VVVVDGINYTNNPVVSEIAFASSMRHGLGRRFQRAQYSLTIDCSPELFLIDHHFNPGSNVSHDFSGT
jgi:hypothetical protein